MPIYRYRCPNCQAEAELILSIDSRDVSPTCKNCGSGMGSMISGFSFKMGTTSKGMVLDTLNREHKILPPKQVEIMAGGLNPPPMPVIGRGF